VDVGAAQEVGFANKQRVEFTVCDIEASYISAVGHSAAACYWQLKTQ
jgi:hypothetical protein